MVLEKWNLDGEVAIVTGGGTGLGKAISLALAGAGADIVLAARRPGPLEEVAAQVKSLGRRALAIPTDVTDSKQVESMVARAVSEFGGIDILVNNAGAMVKGEGSKPVWEITDQEWHQGIDVNLTGAFYCCRAVAKHMIERRRGRIINISSAAGLRGMRYQPMYCSSKAGVIGLTMTLALSWAEWGVRVNCLAPAWLATWYSPEEYESRARLMILGRVGLPGEVGPLAVYLASDASQYVTGQVFSIDGGVSAGGAAPVGYAPAVAL